MLEIGSEIDFGVIQKRYAGIFEILIFGDFSGASSLKFCQNGENLNFDPLKNWKKIKISKIAVNDFVSS